MNELRSDALVLFGATGDLAGKMILPAVCALAARGAFEVPLVAVGRHEIGALRSAVQMQFNECAKSRGPLVRHLAARMRYVAGDLLDAATYAKLNARSRTPSTLCIGLRLPAERRTRLRCSSDCSRCATTSDYCQRNTIAVADTLSATSRRR
jgi:glucose-6-phosphate 1-dehydrogenase